MAISSAVVPGDADAERVAIMADHRNMVRFLSRSDNGYAKISGHLSLMVEKAAAKIKDRWKITDGKKMGEAPCLFVLERKIYMSAALYVILNALTFFSVELGK